jgi:hypothetical protein
MRSVTMEQEAATYFLSGQEPVGQVPKQIDPDISPHSNSVILNDLRVFCPERGGGVRLTVWFESRIERMSRQRKTRRKSTDSGEPASPISSSLKRLGRTLSAGVSQPTPDTYRAAREIINTILDQHTTGSVNSEQSTLFMLAVALSGKALPGYATLDYDHIIEIQEILAGIKRYQTDLSQKRPLNFLMLASPGAGKSYFIRCVAEKLGSKEIGAITYNMVGLQRHEDLIPALDAARNLKVEDRLPLLFLDEFDADPQHFALLLPLLWDGGMTLGQHDLKLGKIVIILAGSSPSVPETMEQARSMKDVLPENTSPPKLMDLLSRINGGVLRIPKLSDPLHAAERRADKVCIAVQLLRQRFGSQLLTVPIALLRFIAVTDFRYGVRSITHLIDLIPHVKGLVDLTLSALRLPLKDAQTLKGSSLAYHLHSDDEAHGVITRWKESIRTKGQITVYNERLEYLWNLSETGSLEPEWYLKRILLQ